MACPMRVYRDESAPEHLRPEAELRERIGLVATNIRQFSGVYRFPNFETPFEIELAALAAAPHSCRP